MLFIPHFDIAALCIEALIIVFAIKQRNLPILQNRVYIALVCLLTVVTVLDLTTEIIGINNPENWPRFILWMLNGLYLCGMPGLSVIYIIYCLSLVDYWNTVGETSRKVMLTAITVPYALLVLLICLSPFINPKIAVFTINEFNIYERGPVTFIFLYVLSGVYLFATAIILAVYRKQISRSKIIMMVCYILATIIPVGFQFIFQGLLTGCFGVSLGCLAFIIFVQRPEEYIDGPLNVFNQNGLNVMEQEHFRPLCRDRIAYRPWRRLAVDIVAETPVIISVQLCQRQSSEPHVCRAQVLIDIRPVFHKILSRGVFSQLFRADGFGKHIQQRDLF